ncbi:acyloxyacyl hydrolase [Pleomorphovibrio marinus]|uniref:acyloxyacyl hydrolase n=1 Tax=Pleomorphovibrio marinus TaxID=2164132 RepID=UPI000E0BFBAB|nr:acyloxyacyl hydrolase [Pleomorphovibrio marinus]
MNKDYCLLALFFVISSVECSFGQSYLNLQVSRGYTLAHHQELRDIQGIPNIFKVDYGFILKDKAYQKALGNPEAGLSLTFMDHDNSYTGRSLSLSSYLQPQILGNERHGLYGRLGLGISYVENPYDYHDNPLQLAIGSKINFFGEGQLIYSYWVSETFRLQVQGGITHISNAARKLPNSGLNIIHAGVGGAMKLSKESKPAWKSFNHPEKEHELGKWTPLVFGKLGLKSIRVLNYKSFPVAAATLQAGYRYSLLGSYLLGLDVDFNDGYIQERREVNRHLEEPISFHRLRWALTAGHEFHMNKLSLVTQLGVYVHSPHSGHPLMYQRYGLHYRISKNWLVGATLRAHGGRADYMEWTLGRKLW